jgi:very-short-patch-repair endonuclease
MSYDSLLRISAKQLRNAATPEEKKLWKYLRRKSVSGIKFRRQHIINGYIVDFYVPEAKLVIEIDGGNHKKTKGYDRLRDKALRNRGCMVLRFWNREINLNIRYVTEKIRKVLTNRAKDW